MFSLTFQIAFCVLRDLFLESSQYAMRDLLEKWAVRLPLGEVFERCSTLEWLEERGLVPNQLVVEESVIETGTSGGKYSRLTSPNTVLVWKLKV